MYFWADLQSAWAPIFELQVEYLYDKRIIMLLPNFRHYPDTFVQFTTNKKNMATAKKNEMRQAVTWHHSREHLHSNCVFRIFAFAANVRKNKITKTPQ